MKLNKQFSITGYTLKMIAIITMLIDHIGAFTLGEGLLYQDYIQSNPVLFENLKILYMVMRQIGRMAFPIFCFLLVEGFIHTKNVRKYALRLLLFAFISEVPFDLALGGTFVDFNQQNIFFTLFIGLVVMIIASRFEGKVIFQLITFIVGMLAGYLLNVDYSFMGIFLLEILYFFRFNRKNQVSSGAISVLWEPAAVLGFIPIWFYNGERGRSMKYFFYWFYPVHILILAVINMIFFPR